MIKILLALFLCSCLPLHTHADIVIYGGGTQLEQWWENWSYNGEATYQAEQVLVGDYSLKFSYAQYGALSLYYRLGWDVLLNPNVSFWLYSTSPTSFSIAMAASTGGGLGNTVPLDSFMNTTFQLNTWIHVTVPLSYSGFGFDATTLLVYRFSIYTTPGDVYFDDIRLVSPSFTPYVSISVDATTVLRPINTDIYGVNFASKQQLEDIGYTVNRKGGNSETRYNWKTDVVNHASDWFFQNTPNQVINVSALPYGSASDSFVLEAISTGTKPVIQLTTIGWVARSERMKMCGFNTTKYGNQTDDECAHTHQYSWCMFECGNGVWVNGTNVIGNDPMDTSMLENTTFALGYVSHLREVAGSGANYFLLDNECGLWHSTHRDVHPNPITYDEIWNNMVSYGMTIKSEFPDVNLFGPVSWNFCEYMWSPADGCGIGPDYYAHGNVSFSEYLMKNLNSYKVQNGIQLVDYFDIHYYPTSSYPTDSQMLRSVKSLYDNRYTDESYLGLYVGNAPNQLRVIPRFREWIQTFAPWLKLSISEHNWGEDGIVAALCAIEVLAIFAREGVDMAMRFTVPNNGSLVEEAYRFLLNYDGTKIAYSGSAVYATSSNTEMLPVYSAIIPQTLAYVLLINKDPANSYTPTITINGVPSSAQGKIYVLNSSGRSDGGNISLHDNAVEVTIPSYTVYLIVVNTSNPFPATPTATPTPTPTPTPTLTPIPTSTPSPSPSPSPSPTNTPTSSPSPTTTLSPTSSTTGDHINTSNILVCGWKVMVLVFAIGYYLFW